MTTFSLKGAPVAKAFYNDRHRYSYIQGAFGSGKSVAAIQKAVRIACEQEPDDEGFRKTRIAVVRNTFSQLSDTTIKTWHDWFPHPQWGAWRKGDSEYDMQWVLPDETIVELQVWFRGLDRPDQVSNLLSAEYSMCFFNEARYIDISIFEAMDGRIGRYPPKKDGPGCTQPMIIMDSNPPDEDHWIYKLFEEIRPESAMAFYQPSGLSPEAENIDNLPEGYYQNLADGKDDYFINVYVHGKYGYLREGKPVYPDYNDSVHCVPDLEVIPGPIYIGIDFGLTPACTIAQLAPSGQLRCVDEVTADRAGIEQFLDVVIPYLSQEYPNNEIEQWYADPAGKQGAQTNLTSPFDVMWDHSGIIPIEGEQDPEMRIESVTNLLTRMIDGEPAIVISHKCKKLRKGFTGAYHYRRMKVSKERYADKPDKGEFSHIHDSLQYMCTKLFGITKAHRKERPVRVVGLRGRR